MSWVIVVACSHGAKWWGACSKHDGFSGQLETKESAEDVLPLLHQRSNWYSATGEETPPGINESTFRVHSGPDRFYHFTVMLMTKLFFKPTNSSRASFYFLPLSGERRSDHFAFQKMF